MNKKRMKMMLGLAVAFCMTLSLAPAASVSAQETIAASVQAVTDQTELQNAINAGGTVELANDITLSSQLEVRNAVEINGNSHTLTYNGANEAIKVMGDYQVTLNDVNIDAKGNGGRGIGLYGNAPHIALNNCVLTVNNRGISMHGSKGTGAHIALSGTTLQSSLITVGKTYENWSHQGDSRGLSLWDLDNALVEIKNNSQILGFGYPVNISGTGVQDDVVDTNDTTFDIDSSKIWGWCALNIWTINSQFNITNSSLKGFVETDNEWNSFATIVLNEDIYGDVRDDDKANVFNISGGDMSSTCVSNADKVFHILYRLDKEFMSEFNFDEPEDMPTRLLCTSPYSAFVATYESMSQTDFENWAQTKLKVQEESVVYNNEILAPGVVVKQASQISTINGIEALTTADIIGHEGGLSNE